MIETDIYNLLSGNSTITGLVSTNIYPWTRNQEDGLPALTYQTISSIHGSDISGPNGLVESRVQINCFAATILGAVQLKDAVQTGIDGYQGGNIKCLLLEETNDLPVIEPENEEINVFAKTMDFYVLYKE